MVMNLLAASTGMRQGEIRGLQLQYIHKDFIEVKFSWEDKYGLKEPKNHSERIVPIPSIVSTKIQKLILGSPYRAPEDLLFYGRNNTHPIDKKMVQRTFNKALVNIKITDTQRRDRNVTFHSWRHFFNTLCRVGKVPDSKLQKLTGHKTQAMTEHYTHYKMDDFKDVMKIQEGLFT
jgi:integrase